MAGIATPGDRPGDGPADHAPEVSIRCRDEAWLLDGSEPFTIGRGSTASLRIGADDRGISRIAAIVEHDGRMWWLRNASESRSLAVIDELGLRSVIAPARRFALDQSVTVVIEGISFRHAVEIEAPRHRSSVNAATPAITDQGLPTASGTEVVINEQDRLALAAVFEGYLQPFPRHDPNPRTYADAAERLGWPRTTVVKRIEYIRSRLTRAGVPNLVGENAMHHLAEYVLTTRLVTKADLDALG